MSDLYAVVDTAQDDKLHDLVFAALFPNCLFLTDTFSPVGRAAPYLVPVEHAERLMREWRARGRGRNWGLFVRAEIPIPRLLQRLRTLNLATLPDGRTVLFRWWDPRVLRVFLPTCAGAELAPWFDGVEEWLCEEEGGEALRSYRRREATGALLTEAAAFPEPGSM
jgi:hypothetical protein